MSIKKKNRFLVIGFAAMLILGYSLSIRDTLILKKHYQTSKAQETLFNNIPNRFNHLLQKEQYYDSLLTHYQIAETSIQNNLLKTIDRYAIDHALEVASFDEPHRFVNKNRKIHSYIFHVVGDFKSILGLAYQLEQRNKFGMIASLTFEKLKNYRTGKISLEAQFILQLVQ